MTWRLTLLLVAVLSQTVWAQPWPQITIDYPPNGASFSSGAVEITVDAHDVDGFVAQVYYYIDGEFFQASTVPPFQIEASVGDGRHSVRAIAYDNVGYYTRSAPVYFQVGGEYPVNLLRGPYLQSLSTTSLVVRWRTDWPTNSIVSVGRLASNEFRITNDTRTAEHEVLIPSLTPGTRYFYSIASDAQVLGTGNDFVFHTAPTNSRPVTVWAIGDSGTANDNAEAVRDAYVNAVGAQNTDLWLMLGDNAYESGSDDEYQTAVFGMYPDILRQVPLWPTLGNHDAASSGAPGQFPFLDIFSLPTGGEAGGVSSGTEKYYSFDYANVHFVCLDSQSSSRAVNGPMMNWLREDLAATAKDWIVAYWHHPPYSKGSHNSDTELQMIEMRQFALPILEDYGVDLVLAGHSHVYERSYFLDGHYGFTNSFNSSVVVDGTLGRADDEGPYRKPAGGLGSHRGAVYTVCGCSGEGGPNPFFYGTHPAMAQSLGGFGSLVLRFDGLRLDVQFLRNDGDTGDYFSIDKSQPATVRPELDIVRTINGVQLSWPTSNPDYSLDRRAVTTANTPWYPVNNPGTRVGRRNLVNLGVDHTNQFFRLRAQP